MYRGVIGVLLFVAMVAMAQPQPASLSLSEAQTLMRITNPSAQLAAFDPLIRLIDTIIPADAAAVIIGKPQVLPSDIVADYGNKLLLVPGINQQGDFWVAIMPPEMPPMEAAPAFPPKEPAPGVPGAEKKPETPKTPPPAMYVLVPLADPVAFNKYVNDPKAKTALGLPPFVVTGNYAILNFATPAKQITEVTFDVTPVSKRGVVMISKTGTEALDALMGGDANHPAVIPLSSMLLMPMMAMMQTIGDNVQHSEIGMTMINGELSMETYLVTVPESPLAKRVATLKLDNAPVELAALLPDGLAYCEATGPALAEIPGGGELTINMLAGFLPMVLEQGSTEPLLKKLGQLSAQCTHGKAMGMMPPYKNADGLPSLVAVYRLEDGATTKKTVRELVTELHRLRNTAMDGMLAQMLTITFKPASLTISGASVDTLVISLKMPEKTGNPDAAPVLKEVFRLEAAFSYTKDKLLVTMGSGYDQRMRTLLERLVAKKSGFTAGARFAPLQAMLPAGVYGVTTLNMRDAVSMVVCALPMDDIRKKAKTLLRTFPETPSPIISYTDVKDGYLHSEARIPAEEMSFMVNLVLTGVVWVIPQDPNAKDVPKAPEKPGL